MGDAKEWGTVTLWSLGLVLESHMPGPSLCSKVTHHHKGLRPIDPHGTRSYNALNAVPASGACRGSVRQCPMGTQHSVEPRESPGHAENNCFLLQPMSDSRASLGWPRLVS